jgi:hypothetical protein
VTLELGRMTVIPKTGGEPFHADGQSLGLDLLGFWRWSASDLVSNATRGRLAEYIVAKALDISTGGVRNEWDAFDLLAPSGIKIEIKSAAYLQSWSQTKLSSITFMVRRTRAWDPDTNTQSRDIKRQADVYIFALLAHIDKATLDPLNVNQWQFYVVSTDVLNSRTRSQHSITLKSLETLTGGSINFQDLLGTVQHVTRTAGGS